jgi:hypothetical protein
VVLVAVALLLGAALAALEVALLVLLLLPQAATVAAHVTTATSPSSFAKRVAGTVNMDISSFAAQQLT